MPCIRPIDLDQALPNAGFAARGLRRRSARRALEGLRSTLVPSTVLPAGLLAFGCCALLTLTGVGPRSWQARLCAGGGLDLRSCAAPVTATVPSSGEASR